MSRLKTIENLKKLYDEVPISIEEARRKRLEQHENHLKELERACGEDIELFKKAREHAEELNRRFLRGLDELESVALDGAAEIIDYLSIGRSQA